VNAPAHTVTSPAHRAAEGTAETRRGRGVLALLFAATAIGSTGLAAGGTSGAILGADLAGTNAAAGLPLGLLILGSAAGALIISRQASRGRRGLGLALGYALGVCGAVLVIASAGWRSLPLFLIGSTLLGAANSAIFLTRYAAADSVPPARRGRALGIVFAATAVGAVLSPLLIGPSGSLVAAFGQPRLSGLYVVAVVTFGLSALLFLLASSRRVPGAGRAASVLNRRTADTARGRHVLVATLRNPRARVAFVGLTTTNFIMAGIMAIAPVHMISAGHGLGLVGGVIALHVAGMFGPSPISGWLADRFGPMPVMLIGGVLLIAASVVGIWVDQHSLPVMAAYLAVLGVGWNFGIVGASTLLTYSVPDPHRPHVEGLGEIAMGLAAGVAAPVAGLVAAVAGYPAFSLACLMLAAFALCIRAPARSRDLTS
jgi:MFS family permease